MDRLFERGLQAVAAWLSADEAGLQLVSAAANLLWRSALLLDASGGSRGVDAFSGGQAVGPPPAGRVAMVGCLRLLPGLCPRLLQVHLGEASRVAAGLHTTVLPVLQDALCGVGRAAGEAWEAAQASGGASPGAEDAAALLRALHGALAVRTAARVRCAAHFAALPGDASALEAGREAALAWGALAAEWERGALIHAPGFRDMEEGVWRATAGGASLRELCQHSQ
jgi:hypothetical protein